ncbi:MAG: hypothetical protein JJ974_06430 [Phycisphaerales bacterium]|nr:hypothetical protein [Phycisphaerales bacterium]
MHIASRYHAALCAIVTSTLCAQPLIPVHTKQVTAPPSDITSGMLKLPDPESTAVTSRSALIPVDLQFIDGRWSWSMPIQTTHRAAKIAILPTQPNAWDARLTSTDGTSLNPQTQPQNDQRVSFGAAPLAWIAEDRDFTHLTVDQSVNNHWSLNITAQGNTPGFVLIESGPEVSLSTHIKQRSTLQDQPITLVSAFSDQVLNTTFTAEITAPSGITTTQAARTGSPEVTFVPDEVGPHSIRLIAQGVDRNNTPILLTTQHAIHVAPIAPLLQNPAASVENNQIQIAFAPTNSPRRTILAAEVWGRSNDQIVPVAWISSIVGSDRSLTLDPRWIALAGVNPESLELRSIRLHNLESFVPIEIIDRAPIPVEGLVLPGAPTEITSDMLMGTRQASIPTPLPNTQARGAELGHRLMLVHGYCTDATPFTVSHFSGDLAEFQDYNQSRSHDGFALQMLAQSANMKSFGVVGHSQGGMGALHLYTYYWSGLDWARNGNRLIQSVGAPYQGTALAGNAAVLGDIFGFGCGENTDMTYTGSANWLSLIPISARQQVYYYTTSFEDGFGFDFCNFVTDLLLSDPDDGVIERSAGQLPGANNMGHLEGWCHTQGMRDPAQCTDPNRNAIMNQEAKR